MDTQTRIALSPQEAAQALGIGRTTLYAEMKAGRLTSVKFGRRTLIPVEEVTASLRRRMKKPTNPAAVA